MMRGDSEGPSVSLNQRIFVPGGTEAALDLGQLAMTASAAGVAPGTAAAPELKAQTLEGQPIKLSDYSGKYLLVCFWSTTARASEVTMTRLKAVHEAFAAEAKLAMVSLSVDESIDAPKAWAAKAQLPWTQGYIGPMSKTMVAAAYGVTSVPSVVLIGPDGKIIARNLSGAQIKAAVTNALGGK
jgi:hypothetical protein